ncbi:MAG: type IX secretion system membrane protein PorP/SprF [Saprospiraceae bacterium]
MQNTPLSINLNLKFQMDQTFWIGVGASKSKYFRVECGIILGENIGSSIPLRIGYSFEDGFSDSSNFFGKTHEISLSYSWDTRR